MACPVMALITVVVGACFSSKKAYIRLIIEPLTINGSNNIIMVQELKEE